MTTTHTVRLVALPFAALLSLTSAACFSTGSEVGRADVALAVAPSLGAADTFAILAGSTVTNNGPTMIIGDVGVSPGTAIIGFPPGTISGGSFHSADAPAAAAQASLTTAYNAAAAEPCGTVLTGMDLGGMTLMPDVYCFSTSAQLTGTLTLDGMGDPNAVFVFQIGSTLTTGSAAAVNMIGGARAGRVFWQVGSSATLGTGTQFSGNILAMASITSNTGANIQGRALARSGAVTIDTMNGEAVPTIVIVPDAGILDGGCTTDGGCDASLPDLGPDAAVVDMGTDSPSPDLGADAAVDLGADAAVMDLGTDAALPPRDSGTDAPVAPDAATHGALSGGAIPSCSAVPGSFGSGGAGAAFLLLGLAAAFATRRRRGLRLVLVAVAALMLPRVASAQSFTLDQFHAPETSLDGLVVSRPVDMGHLRPGAVLYLEYAHNPLVYEAVAGVSGSQQNSIVNHQLALHAGVALGLWDRLILFVGGTGNLVMEGDARPGYATADGTRMGDLNLGARVRLVGTPRLGEAWYGALALQVGMSIPTAHLISSETHYSGDGGVTVTPEVLAEVGSKFARLTFNLGARLRGTESIDTLNIGPELAWGVGVGVPIVGKMLEIDVEAYGTTQFDNPGRRATTPLEAIGGLRWRDESGWTVAAGAGPGLARGAGSPDFRALLTVGWTMPAPRAAEVEIAEEPARSVVDSDHDGIVDTQDVCPHVPGPASNHGCAVYVALMPSEVAPSEIVISERIEFDTDEASTTREVSAPILEEVRATLEANPQLRRVAIEGHADERYTDEHNMVLSRKRAESVMRWLVQHGIESNRLEAHGYGEREPFVSGTTPEDQQINRNVQFFILDPAASHPSYHAPR